MNILIILNHQPDIPPFMQSNILYAHNIYSKIYYVNTRFPNNSKTVERANVCFAYPSRFHRRIGAIRGLFSFFKFRTLCQIYLCYKKYGIQADYIRGLFYSLSADACIYPLAKRIVEKHGSDHINILSTWFGACAYTAAKIKKYNPDITAVSLAHSYEILVSRNRYIPFFFNVFKHRYLDGIYFISQRMRSLYFEGVNNIPIEYINKTHVNYLGSYKRNSIMNKRDDKVLSICSCSRMIPLKRLHLMLDVLEKWDFCMIKWTHIGGGELFSELSTRANAIMQKNSLVSIDLKGHKTNDEVKIIYETQPFDLFINLSSIEGVPISIMEAISYGIPVIATNVGGTSEIVTKATGYLLSENPSCEDIIRLLIDYHIKDDEAKDFLRKSTYNYWIEHFNADNNIELLFNSINNIKKQKK